MRWFCINFKHRNLNFGWNQVQNSLLAHWTKMFVFLFLHKSGDIYLKKKKFSMFKSWNIKKSGDDLHMNKPGIRVESYITTTEVEISGSEYQTHVEKTAFKDTFKNKWNTTDKHWTNRRHYETSSVDSMHSNKRILSCICKLSIKYA